MFSAILVCLGHSKEFFVINMPSDATIGEKAFRLLMSLGSPAVLVFFFLSGFLVGGNELKRLFSNMINCRKYFLDRLTRLWSVLIPALLLTAILNYYSCSGNRFSLYCSASVDLASHASHPPLELQTFSHLISNLFFLQPFHAEVFGGNGPLWSLSYEFWYYLVFMSLVLIISSFKYHEFHKGLFFFIPITSIGLLIIDLSWFYLGVFWLSGALLGYIVRNFSASSFLAKLPSQNVFTVLILTAFFVFPAMICVRLFPNSVISYPLMIMLLCCAVTITSTSLLNHKKSISEKIIVRGSEFSFSMYLIHFPLLGLISTYLTPDSRWELTPATFSVIVLSVLIVALAANVFAFFTEDRLTNLRRSLDSLYEKK